MERALRRPLLPLRLRKHHEISSSIYREVYRARTRARRGQALELEFGEHDECEWGRGREWLERESDDE